MITVSQAAVNWQCSQQRVRQWLAAGRVQRAIKLGRDWLIPDKAKRPDLLKRGRISKLEYLKNSPEALKELIEYRRGPAKLISKGEVRP